MIEMDRWSANNVHLNILFCVCVCLIDDSVVVGFY